MRKQQHWPQVQKKKLIHEGGGTTKNHLSYLSLRFVINVLLLLSILSVLKLQIEFHIFISPFGKLKINVSTIPFLIAIQLDPYVQSAVVVHQALYMLPHTLMGPVLIPTLNVYNRMPKNIVTALKF